MRATAQFGTSCRPESATANDRRLVPRATDRRRDTVTIKTGRTAASDERINFDNLRLQRPDFCVPRQPGPGAFA